MKFRRHATATAIVALIATSFGARASAGGGGCIPDGLNNTTVATARAMTGAFTESGQTCETEADYFSVFAQDGDQLTATATPDTGVDIVLALFDAAGNAIDSRDDQDAGLPETLINSISVTGVYILGVTAFSGSGGYTLGTSGTVNFKTLTSSGTNVTQNFDTLPASGSSGGTPGAGWGWQETGSGADDLLVASDGSASGGSVYSFGTGTQTDRAFGTLRDANTSPVLYAAYANFTGSPLSRADVNYGLEEWRLGQAAVAEDHLDFAWSKDGVNFTDADTFDGVTPNTVGTAGAQDGNSNTYHGAIGGSLNNLQFRVRGMLVLRWTDRAKPGAEDGLALDDFQINPHVASSSDVQPDETIATNGAPLGDNTYDDGTAQTLLAKVKRKHTIVFHVVLTNDGTQSESYQLLGCGDAKGYDVSYAIGASDVTDDVIAGKEVGPLDPATGTVALDLSVKLSKKAKGSFSCAVTATSKTVPASTDTVVAMVKPKR